MSIVSPVGNAAALPISEAETNLATFGEGRNEDVAFRSRGVIARTASSIQLIAKNLR
jgi:hypothetical protein